MSNDAPPPQNDALPPRNDAVGRRLTITIHLPAPLPAVADVLHVVTRHWPTATVDLSGPDGWRVDLREDG